MAVLEKYNRKLLLSVALCGVICGTAVGAFLGLTRDLPQIRALENFQPSAVTRILSADNVLLAELFVERRTPVALEAIPDYLKQAILATEDRKFYRHSGVDLRGILRAVIKNLGAGRYAEGASTITQQLARTLFLTPRKTLERKIREAILAVQLERRYTKDELLTFYLNQIYLGSGAYGVEAAAREYFGKSASSLSLAECALIAGLPQAPSRLSPLVDKTRAKRRRDVVLAQMRDIGVINPDAYAKVIRTPVHLSPPPKRAMRAPYFVAFVENRLERQLGSKLLYQGGLTIHTTLSWQMQQAAEKALRKGLQRLQVRMRRNRLSDPEPQGALIVLAPATGRIKAMCGGRDFAQSAINRAVFTRRPPGSAFNPLVFASAIEQGLPPNHRLANGAVIRSGIQAGRDWRPQNLTGTNRGAITLYRAMIGSANAATVKLTESLGPETVIRFAKNMGVQSPLRPDSTLALGASETTLIELTAAYGAFVNRGVWVQPDGVLKVLDRRARPLQVDRPMQHVALSRAGAAVMVDMLRGVVKYGTAARAAKLGFSVGGKGGTSAQNRDTLFIGFTPQLVAGVWVGQDHNGSLGRGETGANTALPIWMDFMAAALDKRSHGRFDLPPGVVQRSMHPASGKLVPPRTAGAVKVLFKEGGTPVLPKP